MFKNAILIGMYFIRAGPSVLGGKLGSWLDEFDLPKAWGYAWVVENLGPSLTCHRFTSLLYLFDTSFSSLDLQLYFFMDGIVIIYVLTITVNNIYLILFDIFFSPQKSQAWKKPSIIKQKLLVLPQLKQL